MKGEKVTILSVDRQKNAVIVNFSNGVTATFDVQFLLDNIEANGNQNVIDVGPEG